MRYAMYCWHGKTGDPAAVKRETAFVIAERAKRTLAVPASPLSTAVRIRPYTIGEPIVTDGPFAETKELSLTVQLQVSSRRDRR